MKFIGITGGVGAGKSEILSYISSKPGVRVMLADEIAHDLMEPGTECYAKIKEAFSGDNIFKEDGSIDRFAMAQTIFADENKRARINAIVHPAVKKYVTEISAKERQRGELKYLFLEAALLIEEHYDEICDELWYIYANEEVRRQRLKASRGYTDEKIDGIFKSQLNDDIYRQKCAVTIDNNGLREEAFHRIESVMGI